MKDYSFRERPQAYGFLLPLIIFIFTFILLPVLGTVVTSFFRDIGFGKKEFIFLKNYSYLLHDPGFGQSFCFTLLFLLVSVPIEMLLGLFFAILLSQPIPFRGVFRACVLVPWAIPAAISGRIWELIYNYNYGLANFLFLKSGFSSQPLNWLGSSLSAFFSIVIADVWKTTPFVTIILLAGLQAIPEQLYAQARVDGTNFWQRFRKITLPLLKPVFMVALLFRTIDALRIFDLIYVLSGGGPGGATTSFSLYGYKYFLAGDFGYGSTVSVVLFLIAFILSLIYIRGSRWGREAA